MKKVLNIISNILVWLVVVVAVCMMIFTVVSVNTFNRSDREIFGYSAFIVMSDSMSKTDFNAGDIVLVKNVNPTTLKEGDIIAYVSQDKDNYGETITHKIRRFATNAEGESGFVTYGTTTGIDDSIVVTYPYILGKYQGHIPKIGTFFHFLKTTQGYVICILIPFVLLILFQGMNCIRLFRQYRAEQISEIREERAQLEKERQEAAEMMKKLQELRAQMGKVAEQVEASEQEEPVEAETSKVSE